MVPLIEIGILLLLAAVVVAFITVAREMFGEARKQGGIYQCTSCNTCFKSSTFYDVAPYDFPLCPICKDKAAIEEAKKESAVKREADEHEERCKQYFKDKKLSELQELIDATEAEMQRIRTLRKEAGVEPVEETKREVQSVGWIPNG